MKLILSPFGNISVTSFNVAVSLFKNDCTAFNVIFGIKIWVTINYSSFIAKCGLPYKIPASFRNFVMAATVG